MKTSLEHLPLTLRSRLQAITQAITRRVRPCEKIILFGSYARGNYVRYDVKVEYGVQTIFRSDLDIMVLVSPGANLTVVGDILFRLEGEADDGEDLPFPDNLKVAPLQILYDRIDVVNVFLRDARYFYADMVREGILLYDAGRIPLAEIGTPDPPRFKEMAEEYYAEQMDRVTCFSDMLQTMYQKEKYTMGSFCLHQATENLYCAILLVFTLYRGKVHDLKKLRNQTRIHCRELLTPFPLRTQRDKNLFGLLCAAYVQARYNPNFVVRKEELDEMILRVNRLREIVEKACTEKIASIE